MPEQDEKLAFVVKVFEHLRTLTSHADGKAGIAIGLQTFLLTNVLGAALVSHTFSNLHVLDTGGRVVFYVLGIAFCGASLMCFVFCILVFTPRKPEEASELERKGLTYFEQISRFKSSADYDQAVKKASNQDLITEFSHENYTLAVTLKHKMKYARYSVNALLLSILFGVLLLCFAITR